MHLSTHPNTGWTGMWLFVGKKELVFWPISPPLLSPLAHAEPSSCRFICLHHCGQMVRTVVLFGKVINIFLLRTLVPGSWNTSKGFPGFLWEIFFMSVSYPDLFQKECRQCQLSYLVGSNILFFVKTEPRFQICWFSRTQRWKLKKGSGFHQNLWSFK